MGGLALAPGGASGTRVIQAAVSGTPVSAQVNLANVNNQGTITLTAAAITAGGNWNNYSVGQGIYIASSTDANGNGATFVFDLPTAEAEASSDAG